MQLAVNYSLMARDLLRGGHIDLDLYKCPDTAESVRAARQDRPAYVHFALHAGAQRVAAADWAHIEHLLENSDTHYINVHIAPNLRDFPGLELDTRDPAWTERLTEATLADIDHAARRFGAERVILENVPWDPDPQYAIPRPVLELDVINRIVRESGCGYLLDLSHARIAALYLGIDEIAYIDAMPVDRLRELHITGTRYFDHESRWRDHYPMLTHDWRLAEHALAQIGRGAWAVPDIVALESGGVAESYAVRVSAADLTAEMKRLAALIDAARVQRAALG